MVRIVGLGPGRPSLIPTANLEALRNAQTLILRTAQHPAATWIREQGIKFETCDDLYDSAENFEELYDAIAQRVIDSNATYGVPGNPLYGELSVSKILQKCDAEVLAAPGFVDSCLQSLKMPVSGSLQIWNAYEPESVLQDARSNQMIYNIDCKEIASNVKLRLLRIFSPEKMVTIVSEIGLENEKQCNCALFELDHLEYHPLVTVFVEADELERPKGFYGLVDVVDKLLGPEGCPWDKEQTHESLKKHLLEESYETLDAIDSRDPERLCEELGDLILQPIMHAQMESIEGSFNIDDVIESISEKLIRRHPHVFGDKDIHTAAEVLKNWDRIKQTESVNPTSILGKVPKSLPSLLRASEISTRAARAGFEWDSIESVWQKVDEEMFELKQAIKLQDPLQITSEFGDLMFSLVNIARWLNIEPEEALRKMIDRFQIRFETMEHLSEKPVSDLSPDEWDKLWRIAKES